MVGIEGRGGAGGEGGACFAHLDRGEAREGHRKDEDIGR